MIQTFSRNMAHRLQGTVKTLLKMWKTDMITLIIIKKKKDIKPVFLLIIMDRIEEQHTG